tara:strand:- start:769 stop:963 length:195 start_codon:yes stop_codon:yes gene_type:complete
MEQTSRKASQPFQAEAMIGSLFMLAGYVVVFFSVDSPPWRVVSGVCAFGAFAHSCQEICSQLKK